MARFEYKVVPAPSKTRRIKGMKTVEDRFSFGMEMLMNDLGAEGWEYQRSETLPCEERSGIRGRITESVKHMLVFRRNLDDAATQPRALLRDYSSEPPPAQMTSASLAPLQAPTAPSMRGQNGPAPIAALRGTSAPARFAPPPRGGAEPQGSDRGYDNGYSNGYSERGDYDDRGGPQFNERPSYEPEYREHDRASYNDRGNGAYAESAPVYDDEDDYDDYEPEEFQRPVRAGARRRPPSEAPWKMAQDWEDDR